MDKDDASRPFSQLKEGRMKPRYWTMLVVRDGTSYEAERPTANQVLSQCLEHITANGLCSF